jgi:hypothetical protein
MKTIPKNFDFLNFYEFDNLISNSKFSKKGKFQNFLILVKSLTITFKLYWVENIHQAKQILSREKR